MVLLLLLASLAFSEEFIVKLPEGAPVPSGLRVIERFKNYLLVDVPEESSRGQLSALGEYVVRNVELRLLARPNDPLYGRQWALKVVKAEKAWERRRDCSGVVVAFVDTGIDYLHEDLRANLWRNSKECSGTPGYDDDGNGYVDDCMGYDFANDDPDPMDDNGHGTHSAGVMGATGNNGKGVAGACWRAKIMALKILDSSGTGTAMDFLKAVHYAVDKGAAVVNTSLGTCPVGHPSCPVQESDLLPLREAVEYALNHGVMVVAAAGNDGIDADRYPVYPAAYTRSYPNVVSVCSVDGNGELSSFSNYGAKSVDLCAPGGVDSNGTAVLSTFPSNTYGFLSGTSVATPFVSAAVAYLLLKHPYATVSDLKSYLLQAVQGDLRGKARSGGYLDLSAVVSTASSGGGGCSTGSGSLILSLLLLLILLTRPRTP